jgi:ribosomal protein S18 acetylase RimI-like enzyme
MKPLTCAIRRLHPSDHRLAVDLLQKVYPDQPSTTWLEALELANSATWVATDPSETRQGRQELYGLSLFRVQRFADAVEAELLDVVVAPLSRRRGVAKTLLQGAFDEVRGSLEPKQIAIVQLEVRADNASALALYHGLGFVSDTVRKGYYRDGMDAVLMHLRFIGKQSALQPSQ